MQGYVEQLRLVQALTGELQLKLVAQNYLTDSGVSEPISASQLLDLSGERDELFAESVKLVRAAESALLQAAFVHTPVDTRSFIQELCTLTETVERLCRFLHSERRIAAKFGPVLNRTISQLHS